MIENIIYIAVGAVAGGVFVYFLFRNPKNDQLKAKVDKIGDKLEKVHDVVKDKIGGQD